MDKIAPAPFATRLLFSLLSMACIYMAIPKSWEEATRTAPDGTVSLADDWARTIEKKKSKFEKHDLYMLRAARDGYFLCKHCPTGKFFLKTGEVYRYGTTGEGQMGRGYNREWLNAYGLIYVRLITADLTTVKIAQTTSIGKYALSPENLARPLPNSSNSRSYWYRLVLPPGNNSLD